LLAVTVNGAPEAVGVALVGLTTQLGGGLFAQLSVTALLYPFTAVSVPLKTALEFACTVNDGLATVNV
jgi:hypothetical protein